MIICLVRSRGNQRHNMDEKAIQSAHSGSIPRVGGLAIYLCVLGLIPINLTFNLGIGNFYYLILSAFPVFAIGFAEDIGIVMSPKRRLFGSLVSGILMLALYGVWVDRLGVPGLDWVLMFAPISIAFTLFATSGVVNAFNLIDGINGFSSYVMISSAICISLVASDSGYIEISIFLMLIVSIIIGFMILNFPFGKIFLGDSGAYVIGHILVWTAILLVNSSLEISPFSILLIFFWPVADTGLAIWRRWKLGRPTDRPDRLHFHQLAMRLIEIKFIGRGRRTLANPIATLALIPFVSVPQILGVYFSNSLNAGILSAFVMLFLFVITYFYGLKLGRSGHLRK